MYTDKDNSYISLLYDLVEAVYYRDYEGISNKAIHNHIEKCYKACKNKVAAIRDLAKSLSFKDMWDFADFIITAEKVYFYQNVQKSGLCCDKCTLDERILFFDYSERNVFIKITMHASSAGHSLNIIVYREYGKKIITQINVNEDGTTNINSDDDQMLANTINAYVQNSIADLYECYVELAKTKTIYDTVVGYTEK